MVPRATYRHPQNTSKKMQVRTQRKLTNNPRIKEWHDDVIFALLKPIEQQRLCYKGNGNSAPVYLWGSPQGLSSQGPIALFLVAASLETEKRWENKSDQLWLESGYQTDWQMTLLESLEQTIRRPHSQTGCFILQQGLACWIYLYVSFICLSFSKEQWELGAFLCLSDTTTLWGRFVW